MRWPHRCRVMRKDGTDYRVHWHTSWLRPSHGRVIVEDMRNERMVAVPEVWYSEQSRLAELFSLTSANDVVAMIRRGP